MHVPNNTLAETIQRDESTMAGWSQPFTVRQRQQTMMSGDQAHQTSNNQVRPKQEKDALEIQAFKTCRESIDE